MLCAALLSKGTHGSVSMYQVSNGASRDLLYVGVYVHRGKRTKD